MLAAALALPAEAQVRSPGPAYHGAPPPMTSPDAPGYGAPIPPSVDAPTYRGAPPQGDAPHYNGASANGAGAWQGGRWVAMPPQGPIPGQPNRQRWGATINGRWYAGAQAPGGWNAYRHMGHGDHLPGYWLAASFLIADYLAWGLAAPPYGYHWTRYYDDAVLVDDRGRVWDSVGGITWYADSDRNAYSDDYSYSAQSYSESHANAGAGYAPPPAGERHGYAWGGSVPPVAYAPPAAPVQVYGGGYSSYAYSAGGTSVTVINIPGPVTTTTTTTEQVVSSYHTVRRTARRHVVHASSCCPCACR
jgi:Ni/Co efflux regulator RcnB